VGYFLMPHLEWYNLQDFVVFGSGSVGVGPVLLATLYAAVWVAIFLVLAWVGFRRKNLNT
jgi:hypothetical protein